MQLEACMEQLLGSERFDNGVAQLVQILGLWDRADSATCGLTADLQVQQGNPPSAERRSWAGRVQGSRSMMSAATEPNACAA